MSPELMYFSGTLFLALVVLLKWKRRRDLVQARFNRNLRVYISTAEYAPEDQAERQSDEPVVNTKVA